MRHRLAAAVLLATCALLNARPTAAQAAPPLPADSTQRARAYAEWFVTAQADSLWPHVVQSASRTYASKESLSAFLAQFTAQAGAPGAVIEERWGWRNGMRMFWHTRRVGNASEPVVLRLVMANDGRLAGHGAQPQSTAPVPDSGGPVLKRP